MTDISDEMALLEQAQSSHRFLGENHDEIRRRYPNKWIAIRGGKVVASAESPRLVRKALERLGFDDNRNLLEFVPDPDTRIMA